MKGTLWTAEQIAYLTANYGRIPDCRLAVEVGHSDRGFRAKVFSLGLKRPKAKRTVTPGARPAFELLVEAIARRELTF